MLKEWRLRKREQFTAVQREGQSWAHPLLILRARPNEVGLTRYGFSVSKRVGKAVVRNRVRRLLREAVRLAPGQGAWDIVLIARDRAAEADFHQIGAAVADLFSRARLAKRDESRSQSAGREPKVER